MILTLLSWFAAAVCVFGLWLNARKKLISWPIWIVGGLLWTVVAVLTQQWALLVLNLIYIPFEIFGWREWKQTPPQKCAHGDWIVYKDGSVYCRDCGVFVNLYPALQGTVGEMCS